MARSLTAVVAVLGIAACGASDGRPLAAPTTTRARAAASPDVLLVLPEVRPVTSFVRLIPPAAASRGTHRTGGGSTSPRAERRSGPPVAPENTSAPASNTARSVSSTAYCERGTMANGQRTYDGAVAMNGVPMGSRWHVLSGPYAGRVLTVADHVGHGSGFDIAMPGRCAAAVAYGRRQITIERVG